MAESRPNPPNGKAPRPASAGKASPTPASSAKTVSDTSLPSAPSFAEQLFLGRFAVEEIIPYYEQPENEAAAGDSMVTKTKDYCRQFVFADRIDQHSMLPPGIIKGMGNIGVLGMTVDKGLSGNKMSTSNFCRVLEILGGHCGSTAAMIRLQSCMVLNLLQTYGTPQQQQKWIPAIASGDQTGAMVITEELAGSDIGNVHTSATPKDSGKGYKITGEKRWISNGGKADLLIVLTRTPDDYGPAGKVTAFLVASDAKGITTENNTDDKLGLKGVPIGTIAFKKVSVANEDLLGKEGHGIEMVESASILDRIAFAATAVGGLKFLLEAMISQAKHRTQFGQPISSFNQVKEKIANVAANLYALESAVYYVAPEYTCAVNQLTTESQMLKLFASQTLYSAVNDAMDIWGGKSVFKDQPLERLLRNARHSLTSEGSNDLLKMQIAENALESSGNAIDDKSSKSTWLQTAGKMLPSTPTIEVKHEHLRFHARSLASHIGKFGWNCRAANGSDTDDTLRQSRVADLATNLFLSSCVFSKLSALMVNGTIPEPEKRFEFDTGALFLQQARVNNLELFDQLKVNFDDDQTSVADRWLSHKFDDDHWPILSGAADAPDEESKT